MPKDKLSDLEKQRLAEERLHVLRYSIIERLFNNDYDSEKEVQREILNVIDDQNHLWKRNLNGD